MFRDRAQDALRIAAAATLERIRRDGARVPYRLASLFVHLAENLFDPDLNATRAWLAAGIRDHSLSTLFRDFTGKTLKLYITEARVEVAERMLRSTDLEIGRISLVLGYTCHGTFISAFKTVEGKRPSEVRREPSPKSEALEAPRSSAEEAEETCESVIEPRIVVDGERYERFRAEELWQELCELSPEAQRRRVRRYLFHSTALFDLLREKSRVEGRRDRPRGIVLAELALVSLEGSKEVFGERIHDLRALGWAWLGNAHVLASDFSEAEAAFQKVDAELGVPREKQDELAWRGSPTSKGHSVCSSGDMAKPSIW